jgi:hypothetical protein
MTEPMPTTRASTPALPWGRLAVVGLALCAGAAFISQGRDPDPARLGVLLAVLLQEAMVAAVWWVTAAGLGWAVRWCLMGRSAQASPILLQLALGAAALLMLDWTLAWAGLMHRPVTLGLAAVGGILLLVQARVVGRHVALQSLVGGVPSLAAPAAVVTGLMLGAATVPPAVLWASEFGGYDVLSYHLQLPAEWRMLGHMTGLHHNVYSYMPNLFETGFMHLATWRAGVLEAAYACQLLHAGMAIMAAVLLGRTASLLEGDLRTGAIAGGLYLALPWTLVTGSMAYNEQAVMMLGAGAALVVVHLRRGDFGDRPLGAAVGVGLLVGAATLCKLTAGPMIGLPLLVVMGLALRKRPHAMAHVLAAAGAALVVCLPWLVRNTIWTGNPVFPMLGEWLGSGHWTTEQAARWAMHHGPPTITEWPSRLWHQWLGHAQFGWLLWPAAAVAAWLGLVGKARSVTAAALLIIALQLAVWLLLTHQQSRFAIPLAGSACVLIAVGVAQRRWAGIMAAVLVAWLAAVSVNLYLSPDHAVAAHVIGGHEAIAQQLEPYAGLRDQSIVPPGSRIYAEGFATPLYVEPPISYHTVWDTGLLRELMTKHDAWDDAFRALHAAGYTHLLVDYGMIRRWGSPGNYGYDPWILAALTHYDTASLLHAERHRYPGTRIALDERRGLVLYRLGLTGD